MAGLLKALQKPEESVRRPSILNDALLLNLTNNAQRKQLAEQDAVTIADTLYALVSQIRQILYGTSGGTGSWSDVPPASLADVSTSLQALSDSVNTSVWTAGEPIARGFVVYASLVANTVRKADQVNTAQTTVIGISDTSAGMGETVRVAHPGRVISGLSGIIPGARYFLQPGGSISTTPPPKTNGIVLLQVGYGKTPTSLLVQFGELKIRP